MKEQDIIAPHGGCGLINRVVPEVEQEHFKQMVLKHNVYTISEADLDTFYRISDGTLSPLEGPMDKKEFYQVLDEEVIVRNGKKYAWTIPIAFPVSKKEREAFKVGETIAVRTEHNEIIGALEISDIYPFDKAYYNKKVYGTDRTDHPGPRIMNNDIRDYLLGGKIWAISHQNYTDYEKCMLKPEETRRIFQERKWQRTVAFQTRNPLHRAHEYTMVYAMETLTKEGFFTGVVLNPLVGQTKSDDVPAEIRMKTYEALINNKLIGVGDKDEAFWKKQAYELCDQMLLVGLNIKMFYAGPKEAVMHAIYRQNFGFTDIIIGRRHADAPFDDKKQVWGDFDAQEKFKQLRGELLTKPINVGFAAYYEELGRVALMDDYKDKGYHTVSISGKDLRQKLQDGEAIDERVMRKPVAEILTQCYKEKKAAEQGIKATNIKWHDTVVTRRDREVSNGHKAALIWMTGLPSSGKSTIAVELQAQLFKRGCQVFVLDGDNVRHGLNKNLGFSPDDRKENIRRIGEVAKLFTDAGFLVITSFISPYRNDRDEVRALVDQGVFLEVYINTSVDACAKRDPKGLYAKAKKGEIKEFTGVSAPYEEPLTPEIEVPTERESKEKSASYIVDYLERKGYIPRI